MRPAIRRFLLPLHRWTAFTAGLVVAVLATAGASMLFRPQIEPLLEPRLGVAACGARISLDTLAANARLAYPGTQPDYIRVLGAAAGAARIPSVQVHFPDQQLVYLDPCSGAVLGQENRYAGRFGAILNIHRMHFLPDPSLFIGSCALAFAIVMIGGGIFMWWPATRQGWRNAFSFRSRLTGPARMLKLHRSLGACAGLVVLSSVLTGLPQDLGWYKRLLYAATGSSQPAPAPLSRHQPGAARLPMQAMWERAQALVPQASDAQLRYPATPDAPFQAYLIGADAPHPNARSMLFVDAYSGEVLRFTPYADSSAGHKLYFWTFSWHTGLVGGVFGKLLLMAGALSIPVLAVTGIGACLRRRFSPHPQLQRTP